MNELLLMFLDEEMYIVNNQKVKRFEMNNIISKGIICKSIKFIEQFQKILKKEKIKSKLFGDNIRIVKNAFYNERDIYFLEKIFEELGFMKILWLDIKDLLPDMTATFVEINNTYIVIYGDKNIFLDLNIFKDIPKILNFLKNYYTNNIVLFGCNKSIPTIKITGITVYYLDEFDLHITKSLLKVNKYGV